MCRTVATMMLDMNSAFNFIQYVCSANTFRKETVKLMKSIHKYCIRRCETTNSVQNTNTNKLSKDTDNSQNVIQCFFVCGLKKSNRIGVSETEDIEMINHSTSNEQLCIENNDPQLDNNDSESKSENRPIIELDISRVVNNADRIIVNYPEVVVEIHSSMKTDDSKSVVNNSPTVVEN